MIPKKLLRRHSTHLLAALVLCAALAGCSAEASSIAWPLPDADDRPTPLHFGLYVTPDPDQNPIDPPERFTGFHAAVDFEVDHSEAETSIPVFAICPGRVIFSGYAEGYGGLLVHRCVIKGQHVTVLYGHLLVDALPAVGTRLHTGQQVGMLAPARSHDSGENRKHLHLGIHKGKRLDFRGYVQTEEELNDYIDPLTVLPKGFL